MIVNRIDLKYFFGKIPKIRKSEYFLSLDEFEPLNLVQLKIFTFIYLKHYFKRMKNWKKELFKHLETFNYVNHKAKWSLKSL